jgi:hypothetical protein
MAQPRNWQIVGDLEQQPDGVPLFGGIDRDEVARMLAELEAIGHYIRGAFTIVPVGMRVRLFPGGPEEYATVAWQFRHDSFVPAASAPPASEAPNPKGRPETVDAEPVPDPWEASVDTPVAYEDTDADEVTPAGASVDHPLARG